ncbi:MAG: hypothetical protein J0L52_00545 [Caulobacterales bacterium]|nr:hypothetical protein [Caulobacterales bacterium]
MSADAGPPRTPTDAGEVAGPLHVTLLGNYVGRHLRVEVDGTVLVDTRLTFPPPGAEHRYTIGWGTARAAGTGVQLDGCDAPWTGDLQLDPSGTAYLLIQDCEVQALAPG